MGLTLTKATGRKTIFKKARIRVAAFIAALMGARSAVAQDLDASVGNDALAIMENAIRGNLGIAVGVLVLGGAVAYAAANRDRGGALAVFGAIVFLVIFYNIPGIVRMIQAAGA